MSFILCRFLGNTAMTRVWRSFGLQETDLLALLEVIVQSLTDNDSNSFSVGPSASSSTFTGSLLVLLFTPIVLLIDD